MSVVIGIDVGGSTTKIVGFRKDKDKKELIQPQFVQANDPITSIYGAFGKFTDENGLALSSIDKVMMTGVGSSYLKNGLYGLECINVPEFQSIGLGGLYLSGLDNALCVSMGTGTALVHAVAGKKMTYLGGTGVGGGTLMGLSRLLLNADEIPHIMEMATNGNLKNVDLLISDMTADDTLSELNRDLTASNFGNLSDIASKDDIASGILNMVFEMVGMISVFGARSVGVKNIILTGNLTQLPYCRKKFVQFDGLYEKEGMKFSIPELSNFATAIGTALCG
ncbi:MAG: type II pantothenate kinase [Clostridia bacterium]|nr:type II pantothenate kinase [Clostridia bacterium]